MTYSWDEIKNGDVVELEHDRGNTLRGEVYVVTDREFALVGMPLLRCATWEIKNVTKSFRDGDIGVWKSSYSGANYVGIYDKTEKAFLISDGDYSTDEVFDVNAGGVKIVGNVNAD